MYAIRINFSSARLTLSSEMKPRPVYALKLALNILQSTIFDFLEIPRSSVNAIDAQDKRTKGTWIFDLCETWEIFVAIFVNLVNNSWPE